MACVLISNNPLDAAKMNRTVCVRRPAPNLPECQALLADAMGYPSSNQPDVAALCAAYCSLMASGEALVPGGTVRFRDRFGLRDLYAFGRWFKRTGRRVFLMAPLHHHFEKKGWAEPTIVIRFWIIAMILALVGLSTLKIR